MAGGYWTRATAIVSCTSLACARSMVRDEAVYLVAGVARQVVCAACAQRRFQRTPPENLPHLPPLVMTTPTTSGTFQDSAEPQDRGAFAKFDRARVGGTLRKAIETNRREAAAAAAVDPKLKQLGEADR